MSDDDAAAELRRRLPGLTGWRLVGRGGFASVYAARQAHLGRTVAVKLLGDRPNGGVLASFLRECELLGSLPPNESIVTVYDAGVTDQGRAFLVMSFVGGGTLAQRIEDGGVATTSEIAHLGRRIADALHTAHEHGILHLDVKPANVLLTAEGDPVLGDFGVARLETTSTTEGERLPFSPFYAAPEVLTGGAPTRATDVYGLGATLCTLMRGAPPFWQPAARGATANDPDEVVARTISRTDPEVPTRFGPELHDLVRRMLDRRPDRRPDLPTVERTLLDLGAAPEPAPAPPSPLPVDELLLGDTLAAVRPPPAVAPTVRPGAVPFPTAARTGAAVVGSAPGRRRGRWRAVAVAVLAIGAPVLGGVLATRRIDHAPRPSLPSTTGVASAATAATAATAAGTDGAGASASPSAFPALEGAIWVERPQDAELRAGLMARGAGTLSSAEVRSIRRGDAATTTVVRLVLDPSTGVVDEAGFTARVAALVLGGPDAPEQVGGLTVHRTSASGGSGAVALFRAPDGTAWLVAATTTDAAERDVRALIAALG